MSRVFQAVVDAIERGAGVPQPESLVRLMHRSIKAVTNDLERFRFNVAISKLMVLTNEIRSSLDAGGGALAASRALVQMLAPFAPFAAEELWRVDFAESSSVHVSTWPSFDPALAAEETATLVVQVDGKVRDRLEVPADASEEVCREAALASSKVRTLLDGAEPARVIVRPPRLVNVVTRAR
jgi:leucyl-tRNA synthetase